MKNKTILFVCVFIALSISLQCNISVCAQIEENNENITNADDEVIEGTSISSDVDDQEQEYLSN